MTLHTLYMTEIEREREGEISIPYAITPVYKSCHTTTSPRYISMSARCVTKAHGTRRTLSCTKQGEDLGV